MAKSDEPSTLYNLISLILTIAVLGGIAYAASVAYQAFNQAVA